jgi:flagellar hook-associated protein 1 FlgK
VTEVNRLAQELARTNVRLARASDATSDQTSLLDQRDNLLQQMSQYGDIATTFSPDGTVKVQIGGAAGPAIVNGGSTDALAAATAADGTITLSTASGASVALSGGSLAGQNLALGKLSQLHGDLDALAANIVTTVNGVQTGGVDVDGNPAWPCSPAPMRPVSRWR